MLFEYVVHRQSLKLYYFLLMMNKWMHIICVTLILYIVGSLTLIHSRLEQYCSWNSAVCMQIIVQWDLLWQKRMSWSMLHIMCVEYIHNQIMQLRNSNFILLCWIWFSFVLFRKEINSQWRFFHLRNIEENKFYIGDRLFCIVLYVPYVFNAPRVTARTVFIIMMCIKLFHEVWVGCMMEAFDDSCVLQVCISRMQVKQTVRMCKWSFSQLNNYYSTNSLQEKVEDDFCEGVR